MSLSTILQKIVTPGFITYNAHVWFSYAVVFTFYKPEVAAVAVVAAGVKEFYIDKHFEADQSFTDNLTDFSGYCVGVVLAVAAHRHGL